MFSDEVSSDEDNYREYDGYVGSSEMKKMRKKAANRRSAPTGDEDNLVEDDEEETVEDDGEKAADDTAEVEDDVEIGIKSNIFSRYAKKVVIIPPNEHMSIDKLSKYEYSRLVSIETRRIEIEDNPFVTTDGLTYADMIAEKTVNMNREPYLIERSVGFDVDHVNRLIIEYKEIVDPKMCRKSRLNASNML
jgi:hypothetical protein